MHILIVDDDEDITTMLEFRLKKLNFTVSIVSRGDEVITAVSTQRPNIILLDLNIPGPNGIEVCNTLKTDANFATIPIILLTGMTTLKEGESKADLLILKPYEWPELEKAIQTLSAKQPS